jgi:uncharacterized protein YycO
MHWLHRNESPASRSRSGAAIYVGRALLIVTIAFGALGTQPARSTYAAESGTLMDLSIDDNQDNIPDQLAAAVDQIGTLQTEEEQKAAIEDLVRSLPYSEETRALQDQAGQLQQQLAATTDDAEAEQLTQQIAALGEEMKQDPAYAKTVEALDALFKPEGAEDEMRTQSIPWGVARRGDILLEYNVTSLPTYLYAMNYGHAGNCYSEYCYQILESVGSGVRLNPRSEWSDWWKGIKFVTIARSWASQSSVINRMVARKVQFIDQQYTPYNFNWTDKWREDRVYCSQLTWKIHLDTGRDLDSNHWSYYLYIAARWSPVVAYLVVGPAVAPDEVALSSHIYRVGSGWNV